MHDDQKTVTRGMRWAIGGLIALFIVGFIVSFFVFRARAKSEIASHTDDIQSGVAALTRFDFSAAARQFQLVAGSSSDEEMSVAGRALSLFTSGHNPVGAFIDFSKQLSLLSGIASSSKNDVLGVMPGAPRDGKAVGDLSSVADILRHIDGDIQNLSSAISLAGNSLPGSGDFLALATRLHAAETFLEAFRPWFADRSPHHLLVLFQNPAELRPSGGFLGSYADMTVAGGGIENIAVHDIAEVDAGFTPNIVPPAPLQLEVSRWRPADANWFFDFPATASQTISFFERSQLYAASRTSFDGVIAISPQIMRDLLSITGPITVSSSRVAFDSADFLVQIQKIVQAGQAQSATYPKQILSDLAHAVVVRLASSTEVQKQQLLGIDQNLIANKNVQAYFKNPAFENFVKSWGAAGDVYALPKNFEGDYLALASANVNGEKSDLYVAETVNWQSQINLDGTVTDHLTLTRAHTGNLSPYWWYRAPNQSYLQLFTPDGTTLTNESGGLQKTVPAPINYAKSGFSADPLVAAIESSTQPVTGYPAVTEHQESGKDVFAAWSRVAAGRTASLSFDFTRRLYVPIEDGTAYQFVFEKQSGASRRYTFEIDAPLGYIFAETNLASWTLESGDVPGRLIENLTLKKI
jgi:hypothetical protein